MRAYERLLNYVQFDTASNEASETCPSTPGQLELGRSLVEEMRLMGVSNARMDENGYVYGEIPANAEGYPTIGLIAHMDTVDCVPALPMHARIVENYDGGAVQLEGGDTLDPADYPELKLRAGKDLIVTDGRTLLGADDKAGVAEIMTACEQLIKQNLPHGDVRIAFTPDEEIGRGADRFDVKGFGADYAYTVDGDELGGIEYENFNAASAQLTFHGRSVHPGSAKNKLVNAALLAMEFDSLLPPQERPEHTEGYEGFYHLCGVKGETELAESVYILRDHDRARFEARKETVARIAAYMNEKYGAGAVECNVQDSYYNMREVIEPRMDIIRRAEAAFRAVGVTPFEKPIRGGTDGSKLSFMGLPCPNLSTGGMNYHGRFECIAVQDMDAMADMLVALLTLKG
ncbi:MAG: peptidase T [Eubacteriales bacterium]|nr:peptidase T [Eubacteriales bacterium]